MVGSDDGRPAVVVAEHEGQVLMTVDRTAETGLRLHSKRPLKGQDTFIADKVTRRARVATLRT